MDVQNKILKKFVEIVNEKCSNLVVSLDLEDPFKILKHLDLIGPHICAVKLHLDIIDFTCYEHCSCFEEFLYEFTDNLDKIKHRHNFMVIEDRKFADIPFIVSKQFHIFNTHVDMVTVHGIMGHALIEAFEKHDVGLLLIHKLSLEGNFLRAPATYHIRDLATKYPNIVGFISREKVLLSHLTFQPGISFEEATDKRGQTYRLPNASGDIFIVGRDIYESDDILAKTIEYKTKCWPLWRYHKKIEI